MLTKTPRVFLACALAVVCPVQPASAQTWVTAFDMGPVGSGQCHIDQRISTAASKITNVLGFRATTSTFTKVFTADDLHNHAKTSIKNLLDHSWHGNFKAGGGDDKYKHVAGDVKKAKTALFVFDDGDISTPKSCKEAMKLWTCQYKHKYKWCRQTSYKGTPQGLWSFSHTDKAHGDYGTAYKRKDYAKWVVQKLEVLTYAPDPCANPGDCSPAACGGEPKCLGMKLSIMTKQACACKGCSFENHHKGAKACANCDWESHHIFSNAGEAAQKACK